MGPVMGRPGRGDHDAIISKTINVDLALHRQKDRGRVKVLMLGTGESGKTTLLKQMKLLYGVPKATIFADEDNVENIKAIRMCVISNLQELVKGTIAIFGSLSPNVQPIVQHLLQIDALNPAHNFNLDDNTELIQRMVNIWHDPMIQQCWEDHRNKLQVQDSLPYFMLKVSEIFSSSYVPAREDWLRVRVKTSGVTETFFRVDEHEFVLTDVGGQRNERRKWLYCFSRVHAVIYVVAMNEYDQVAYEDNITNRMLEALSLFETVVNDKNLRNAGWILFMNKSDLYEAKLNRSPIRVDSAVEGESRFTDFQGPYCPYGEQTASAVFKEAYEAGITYFQRKFNDRIRSNSTLGIKEGKTPKLTFHVTCAMDQHRVHVVFNSVKGHIISSALSGHGFLPLDI